MSISNFEYKKMSVTCLGPVHITDEVGMVYSYQYLYDAGSRRVYFLNERLWVKFLYKHNLLAEFEELIKTRLRAGSGKRFLNRRFGRCCNRLCQC